VAVFAAFKEEIVERNISNAMFPRANRGVEPPSRTLKTTGLTSSELWDAGAVANEARP
jgi:hypothetical protein